jgi:para-aminobenzoate synthetase component 1
MTEIFTSFYIQKKLEWRKLSDPVLAYAYYESHRLDLLSGDVQADGLNLLVDSLKQYRFDEVNSKREELHTVYHLTYELGDYFLGLQRSNETKHDQLLAIEIRYQQCQSLKEPTFESNSKRRVLLRPQSKIKKDLYKKLFKQGMEEIFAGNCYQFNLTFQHLFKLSWKGKPHKIKRKESNELAQELFFQFYQQSEKLASYAHFSFIGPLQKIVMSNSPEGLFSLIPGPKINHLFSFPIKGTIKLEKPKREDHESAKAEEEAQWKLLRNSEKNAGELNMITDMLRNDLTKVSIGHAKIIAVKRKIKVNKILHQYSILSCPVKKSVNLFAILKALYPGASITGAPKKRVTELLKNLEPKERGFYTGSTLICHKGQVRSSLNIRTALVDLEKRELSYGAGGGITFLCNWKDEFNEMMLKVESFTDFF